MPKKHAYGEPPVLSLLNCLSQAGVAFEDIDLIALSWDPQKAEELGILEKFKKHPVLSGKKCPLSFRSATIYAMRQVPTIYPGSMMR